MLLIHAFIYVYMYYISFMLLEFSLGWVGGFIPLYFFGVGWVGDYTLPHT